MVNRLRYILKMKITTLLIITLALFMILPARIEAFSVISPISGSAVKSAKLSINGRVDEPGKVIVDLGRKGDLSIKLASKSQVLIQSQEYVIDFFPEDLRVNPGEILNLWLIAQFLPEDKNRIPPFPLFLEFTWEVIGSPAPLPTIIAEVTPASIVRGATATLTWSTTNATSVTVSPSIGISPLPLSGSTTVSPTTTTTYLFTSTGPGGTAESQVTLTVTEPPPTYPPTITASVSPISIERGQSATLTWSTTNATSVTVSPSIGISPLPLSGSATVSPTSTTTYVFTAIGAGGTAEERVNITVTEPPPPPPTYRTVELRIGSTIYKVDGVTSIMDAAPYIEEGRTMVPVRFLAEGLGGTVGWDNTTRTVTVRFTKPILEIKLIIGNPIATVNGLKVPIDPNNAKVVPVIKNNRTFVPLRFLVEQITGSSIDWIPPNMVVMRLPR